MRIVMLIIFLLLSAQAEDAYRFGVFPHMPTEKLYKVYSEVRKDLELHIGHPIVLTTKPYYELYKQELNKGTYDIAFIQPFDYVQAHEKQGYIPIARRTEDLTSILVVSKASAYDSIDAIKNKIIASAPASAAVTQMMIRSLENDGHKLLDDFTISYSKNHFVCLQKVVDAEVAGCITARRAMEYFNQDKHVDSFKIIYETKPLPHALFVVHPRVPERIRTLLQERIVKWDSDEKGRFLLKQGNLLTFKKTDDKEYDAIRAFMKNKK